MRFRGGNGARWQAPGLTHARGATQSRPRGRECRFKDDPIHGRAAEWFDCGAVRY